MLVLDVLHDGIPAPVVVDKITVAGGINNVESEADAVLLDDVGNGLDLGGRADNLVGLESTLGLDEVRGEDGVDQSRLSEARLTCIPRDTSIPVCGRGRSGAINRVLAIEATGRLTDTDNIELEAAFEKLALNLGRDAVETDMALGVDGRHRRHCFSIAEFDSRWITRLYSKMQSAAVAATAERSRIWGGDDN